MRVSSDAAGVQRHVQVGADENALALELEVGHALEAHVRFLALRASSLMAFRLCGRLSRTIATSALRSTTTGATLDAALLRVHQGNRGVEHPVAEAPLVVVPRGDFYEGAVRHLGEGRIEDRACRIVIEVG